MAKLSLNKLGLHKMPIVEKETFEFLAIIVVVPLLETAPP